MSFSKSNRRFFCTLGSNVTQCRERIRISLPELSSKVAISTSSLREIEEGQSDLLDIKVIADIADVLGISVSDLTEGIPKSVVQSVLFRVSVRKDNGLYLVTMGNQGYIVDTRDPSGVRITTDRGKNVSGYALFHTIQNIVREYSNGTGDIWHHTDNYHGGTV